MSRLTLSETIGLRTDLDQKLSGEDGHTWLAALKKFLLKQNPWEEVNVVNAPSPPAPILTFAQAQEKAYEMIGAKAEYDDFVKEFGVAQTPGMWTLAMIATPKLAISKIMAALREAGSNTSSYYSNPDSEFADDPQKNIRRNDRNPCRDGSYFVDLQSNVEADPENANQSANWRRKEKRVDVTVLERWSLELVYFLMTGKNLDINNWTMCSGSRDSSGSVPCVGFYSDDRGVHLGCCHPGDSDGDLRARSAVPRQPKVGANS